MLLLGSKASEKCLAGQTYIVVPPPYLFHSVLCLLTFACTHATTKQIVLTLQFCKISNNQMISILEFLAVGKKWFIKVLFGLVVSLFLMGLTGFWRE